MSRDLEHTLFEIGRSFQKSQNSNLATEYVRENVGGLIIVKDQNSTAVNSPDLNQKKREVTSNS